VARRWAGLPKKFHGPIANKHALRRLLEWLYLHCDWLHNASSVSCRFFENIKAKTARHQATFARAAR
jgi:hypothetical protein